METRDVLREIVERRRRSLERLMEEMPLREIEARLAQAPPPRGFVPALRSRSPAFIAEVKFASPSRGRIRDDLPVEEVARGYEKAGAVALSVLTEPHWFSGSLDHLERARGAVSIPVLRKDFIVDAYQVYESRAAGADAILLIVQALAPSELGLLLRTARSFDLAVLVEVHTEEEIRIAIDAGADVVGVNNRDLATLEVDLGVAERLRPHLAASVLPVVESGIRTPADVARLRRAGYDCFLVGTHLMEAPSPGGALSELVRSAAPLA